MKYDIYFGNKLITYQFNKESVFEFRTINVNVDVQDDEIVSYPNLPTHNSPSSKKLQSFTKSKFLSI